MKQFPLLFFSLLLCLLANVRADDEMVNIADQNRGFYQVTQEEANALFNRTAVDRRRELVTADLLTRHTPGGRNRRHGHGGHHRQCHRHGDNHDFEEFCSSFLAISPFATTVTATGTTTTSTTTTETFSAEATVTSASPTITETLTESDTTIVARRSFETGRGDRDARLSSQCLEVVTPKTTTVTVETTTTETNTASITESSTTTVNTPTTTTTTATAISTVHACQQPPLTWTGIAAPLNTEQNSIGSGFTAEMCCTSCFETPGCVYWFMFNGGNTCFLDTQVGATTPGQCPDGVLTVLYSDGNPAWGPGPCGVPNH